MFRNCCILALAPSGCRAAAVAVHATVSLSWRIFCRSSCLALQEDPKSPYLMYIALSLLPPCFVAATYVHVFLVAGARRLVIF